MSSNLIKGGYANVTREAAKVIDVNDILFQRIGSTILQSQQSAVDGFISGLVADNIEVKVPFDDEEEQGNVYRNSADMQLDLENSQREAEDILKKAKAQAEEIKHIAETQAEIEKQQAMEQARQQGYAEGVERSRQEFAVLEAQMKEKEKTLEQEYQRMVEEWEPQIIDTITGIYEHIFNVELQSRRDILCHLITATMRKTEGNRDFLVHVSSEDYAYVSTQKEQIIAAVTPNSSVEIIEDMTLGKNQCMIETDGGIFDCGLGTQLTELSQKLKLLSYEK